MKKLKKLIAIAVVFFCGLAPAVTACNPFGTSNSTKLATPVVTMHKDSKCLTWKSINNAYEYLVYCNNECVDRVDNVSTVYDFDSLLTEVKEYKFYIKATSNSSTIADSEISNLVTYTNSKVNVTIDSPELNESDKIIETSIDGRYLSFNKLQDENVDSYILYIYSASSGLKKFSLDIPSSLSASVDIRSNEYGVNENEIYAVRMGYKIDEEEYISSDIEYYNPAVKYTGYTDNIYIFDDKINDFYICSMAEMKNVIYYAFINRISDFDIKISQDFYSVVEGAYSNYSYFVDRLDAVIGFDCIYNSSYPEKIGYVFETLAYGPGNTNKSFAVVKNATQKEYNIKIVYGANECNTSILPMSGRVYPQAEAEPYYDTVDYVTRAEMYGEKYDNFVSDRYFLYTTCTTTEQLYWAVENKVTPVFAESDTSSRAYLIYNQAKKVLNNIISDDMTDYEIALSIFDWICVNTSYDHTKYGKENSYNPMQVPAFYLEGVFTTGYAVCDGFSKAYSLMCNMMGIDTIRILGTADTGGSSGGHAWNKILLDVDEEGPIPAKYYLVDITWTDLLTSTDENLTHKYFLLSDEDVANTHFAYEGRADKIANAILPANSNYWYYKNQKYLYDGSTYDLAIENDADIQSMLYYILDNAKQIFEIVIDYQYMVDYYNANHSTPYDPSSDIIVSGSKVYKYTKLKNYFLNKMKSIKDAMECNQQFLLMTSDRTEFEYTDGKYGIVFIINQNLLIDEVGDIEKVVSYLSNNQITGTFTIYIDNEVLSSVGKNLSYNTRFELLFEGVVASSNIKVSYKYLASNQAYSDAGEYAAVYEVTIESK